MSHSADEAAPNLRACSVQSVSTVGGDNSQDRRQRKSSRVKHSWQYVAVDPAEDEAPPPTATRLEKELFSSFTNNFLTGGGRRTRAAAIHASQNLHDHSGSDGSASSHSKPASESAFSTTTSNTAASPASSPAPPSAPNGSRKRKDSAAPIADAPRKKAKNPTPAPSATSAPAPAVQPVASRRSVPVSSPPPSQAPAVQRAQSVQHDKPSALTSRAPDAPAKDSGKRKSSVFDDATNKTKATKKADAKPSPAPDSFDTRKRKPSPSSENMPPKAKKAKTSTNGVETPKTDKAAATQKRDSLLQENVYSQALPWPSQPQQQQNNKTQPKSHTQHHSSQGKGHYKHHQHHRNLWQPTRAQLAEQLEEITHRGIRGGPANFSSLSEYRAACAAEAAWQERDQEVVERMLDNPRVIEVLKRLRELTAEIEADKKAAKGVGKGHGKGGKKRKASEELFHGD